MAYGMPNPAVLSMIGPHMSLPLACLQAVALTLISNRILDFFIPIDGLQACSLSFMLVTVQISRHPEMGRLIYASIEELKRDGPRTLNTLFLMERYLALVICSTILIGACIPFFAYIYTARLVFSTTWALLRSNLYGYLFLNKLSILHLFDLPLTLLLKVTPHLLDIPGILYRWTMMVVERHKANILLHGLRPISRDTHSQEFFQYKSTEYPEHIRLLSLKSCLFSFKAELITEPLHFAPPFETISYTWGNTNNTHELILDGKPLRIPTSTAEIIRQRASLWKSRLFWIDAVCINQNDEDDKNQQVGMMRDIYSSSSRTIVALGDAPDGDLLFNFVDQLFICNSLYLQETHTYRETTMIREENPKWVALRRLMSHSYWKRAWVIQEIIMAKSVHIHYGGHWYDWNIFAPLISALRGDLMKKMDQVEGKTVLNIPTMDRIEHIKMTKENQLKSKKPDLLELVMRFISTESHYDQDRIFALQGLSAAADERFLEPDYKKTKLEVFEALAKYTLQSPDPFKILALAGIGRSPNSDETWPSWVPDWTVLSKIGRPSVIHECADYSAGGRGEIKRPLIAADHSITLTGILLDRIRRVAIEKPHMGLSMEAIEAMGDPGNNTVDKMMEINSGNVERYKEALKIAIEEIPDYYITGETRWEATWRTLLCNQSTVYYPAEASFGEDLRAYFRFMEHVPQLASDDPNERLEAKFALTDLPTDLQNLIRQPPGDDKATPDDIINMVEKILTSAGLIGLDVRKYLSPDLLADRPRLMGELVKLADISSENAAELLKMAAEEDIVAAANTSPERVQALKELGVRGVSSDGIEDWELVVRKTCLMHVYLLSMQTFKFPDEQLAAWVELSRKEQEAQAIIHKPGLMSLLTNTMARRQFAVTQDGLLALVLPETKPGDVICVFPGVKTPYVLRKVDDSNDAERYRLVGEAYVHGFMHGLAIEGLVHTAQPFQIV